MSHISETPAPAPKPGIQREPFTGPADVIEDCQKQIRGLVQVMEYAFANDAEKGDGPSADSFRECFGVISGLCDRIGAALGEMDAAELASLQAKMAPPGHCQQPKQSPSLRSVLGNRPSSGVLACA